MESLRYLPWLSIDGWLVTNSTPFINIPEYPATGDILAEIKKIKNHIIIDADTIAKESGSVRSGNMVILGAASWHIDMSCLSIENAIRELFGRKGEVIVDINLKAFRTGRNLKENYKS
jgi:indolepyruvate ferredoxin oxidoreductase beta subunit